MPSEIPALPSSPGRRGMRFRTRVALWLTLAMVLGVVLTSALTYRLLLPVLIGEYGDKLKAVAATGALQIDGDAFAALIRPEQMESPEYLAIQRQLRELKAANAHIRFRYVYTMSPTEKPGVWRYVVDAEPATSGEFSALGETEDFSGGDVILEAAQSGVSAADRDVKTYPEWGPLLAAAAPIRNASGAIVGVIGIDAPVVALDRARQVLFGTAAASVVVGVLFAVIAASGLGWQVTRPLMALSQGARAVQEGDLNARVDSDRTDEFGELAAAFNEMTAGLRQRDLYRSQFERYVSRQVAAKILADPERSFWHSERRTATILFADIRGFTAMSEHMPPEEVVARLNEYLGVMIEIVFEHEGTLDKFIGDAIMAVFGAPISTGNDAERAVRAAVAMSQALERMRETWQAEGKADFGIGIGINTGEVVVGSIGSEQRQEYGVIGDDVNLAARLEPLNKDYGTTILISERTYQAVSDLVEVRKVDRVAVRGREQPIDVFEVVGLRESTDISDG